MTLWQRIFSMTWQVCITCKVKVWGGMWRDDGDPPNHECTDCHEET